MSIAKTLALVSLTQAQKLGKDECCLKPESFFKSQAHPADETFMGALGESYHNAWKRCVLKTTDWLYDDLKVDAMDPSFDNGYYVEYQIKSKVPRAYEIFKELLGDYWPAPSFEGSDDSLKVNFNYIKNSLAQQVPSADELPDPFIANEAKDWINEQLFFDLKPIEFYDAAPTELKKSSEGYKMLHELFYNIQQTYYYCDFTLESAMFSFEKFQELEKVKEIEEERRYQKNMWEYILKEQIAPLRWSLKMWTRFNVAESQVHKTVGHFKDNWAHMTKALDQLPTQDLAEGLGWGSFDEKLGEQKEVFDQWLTDFDKWVASCYPAPLDRVMKISSSVCSRGITYSVFNEGLKDSESMWTDFVLPLLKEYKDSDKYDQEVHSQVYQDTKDAIFREGDFHSFKCEFKWFLNRVRYFELIPNWEINRVADDAETYFTEIKEFRTALIEEHGIKAEGLYSKEKLEEMEAKKDAIVEFLELWEKADDSVYDENKLKFRKNMRGQTADLSLEANEIYTWYFQMAYSQFKWKPGKPHDFVGDHYLWADPTAKFVREYVVSDARDGWRNMVWRELVKFNFHLLRRI